LFFLCVMAAKHLLSILSTMPFYVLQLFRDVPDFILSSIRTSSKN
jgi:hypothetical protein